MALRVPARPEDGPDPAVAQGPDADVRLRDGPDQHDHGRTSRPRTRRATRSTGASSRSTRARGRPAPRRSTSLKCAQCHPTSQDAFALALKEGKTPADLAPILAAAHTRLRYDWIADWIKRPDEWMPGTRMPTNFPKVDDKSDKRISPLAPALDTPAFAELKKELVAIWGSEAEAKAYIGDPDRVTKALRDHVWSLGNDFLTAPAAPKATKAPGARRRRAEQ